MTLTEIAIKRPSLIIVIFMVFGILGIFSYSSLNQELIPKFDAPNLFVNTIYPGASPSEVETTVTRPLEEALSSLGKLKLIQGNSSEGVSVIVMEFENDVNVDLALQDAQRKIQTVVPLFPNDVKSPVISKFTSDDFPVLQVGATSTLNETAFFDLMENRVQPALAQVNGVGQVALIGGQKREIKVNLRRDKMEALKISIPQVLGAIRSSNLDFPTGKVKNENDEQIIRLAGKFEDLEQLRALIILDRPDGGSIKLSDIAVVEDTKRDLTTLSRVNGKEAIGISILKQTDANAVAVSEKVRAQMTALEKQFSNEGLKFQIANDTTTFTTDAIKAVNHDLLLAIILVALVCLVFLHSIRNALIVMTAIPTSLVTMFIGMYVLDFTINLMTLLGMSLVVGILVDDSIVVLENIYRHLEMGKKPRQAALDGRNEIGFTAVSITLVDVVVFLPIALSGGIIGNIMRQFALVVVISTLVSLFVSFTVTPMLAARYSKLMEWDPKKFPGFIFAGFEKMLEGLTNWYGSVLKGALRYTGVAAVIVVAAMALFVASFGLVSNGYIGGDFIAQSDRGEFIISLELPKDATLRETNQRALQAEELLMQNKDVVSVFSSVGRATGIITSSTPYKAEINVKLVDLDQRKGKMQSDLYARNIRNELESKMPGVKLRYTPVSFFGGADEDPLQVVVSSANYEEALTFATQIRDSLTRINGATEVRLSVDQSTPEIKVDIDRRKMADLGLDIATVGQVMSIAYSGNTDSKYRSGAYEYDIRVQLDEFDRKNMDDVSNINFINNRGEKVFLYQFASVSPSTGPDRLERRDRVPSVTVKSQVLGRTVGDVGNDLKAIIEKMKKPSSVQYYYEGNLKAQDESMGSLGLALLAALAFMYLIMAALYDDFIYPFVVMFSIPLAFIGALLALALSMSVLDIFTAVGMIMMMGLVGKNAILLIDFANHAKENGQKVRDALVSAGTTRLRPILMTTIAMVFGMMPIALAKGAGAEWKNGLAWALIGGLLSSLLLTMIVVPAFYLLIDRLEHGIKSLSRRLGILKKEESLPEAETSH